MVARWVMLCLGVLVTGGFLFLVTWEEHPPLERIEKTIPDERLPK